MEENRGENTAKKFKTTEMCGTESSTLGLATAENKGDSCEIDALSSLLLFFESSSDSESDSDGENLICVMDGRKALNMYSALLKDCNLFLHKNPRNCVKNYFEKVVPTYTDQEFCRHFRISKSLFDNLSDGFGESTIYNSQRKDKRLSEKLYLAVFLWFAGHEACSFRDIADRFDLSLGTVWNIIRRVSLYISSLSPSVIKWPDEENKINSSKHFKEKCSFSRAIGCIDGTHVIIDPPKFSKDQYIDRKGNASLCLQAVCNDNKKFISIFVGYPGSSHNSSVFQNSPLYTKLSSYCRNYYILGGSAYPCSLHLVTPYRDSGHLSRKQKTFNMQISSGRMIIQHSFGMLKQRFRQLYYCKLRGVKHLCHFIRACCVLHNIASEDDIQFDVETFSTDSDVIYDNVENAQGNDLRDAIWQEIQNV